MITLRMIGIAVAILIGMPVAIVVADHDGIPSIPGGDPLQSSEAAFEAIVRDIELIEPPPKVTRNFTANMPEQLVEGHIVFATIEIPTNVTRTEFNFSVVGSVSCEFGAEGEGVFSSGIPFPTRIEEGFVRCRAGEMIFLSPDPFMDPDVPGMNVAVTPYVPTSSWEAKAPNGLMIDVQEYAFDVTRTFDDGRVETDHLYAWAIPVTAAFRHPDGSLKDWYCPIPEDRLVEMGKTDFWAYHESELPQYFWKGSR